MNHVVMYVKMLSISFSFSLSLSLTPTYPYHTALFVPQHPRTSPLHISAPLRHVKTKFSVQVAEKDKRRYTIDA
jgi:hypothetical protein